MNGPSLYRQPAPLGVHRVAVARQILVLSEPRLARAQPVGARYDFGIFWDPRIFGLTHDQVSRDCDLPCSALTLK